MGGGARVGGDHKTQAGWLFFSAVPYINAMQTPVAHRIYCETSWLYILSKRSSVKEHMHGHILLMCLDGSILIFSYWMVLQIQSHFGFNKFHISDSFICL